MRILYLILLSLFINFDAYAQFYTNVTTEQNISHSLYSGDQYGSGLSFFDFDNDGWDDITLLLENDSLLIYKNNEGIYQKIASPVYIQGEVKQILWVDYDNDDDNDLFISIKNGIFKLLQNDGNLVFTDVTELAGITTPYGLNYGAAFGDYNNDGFLDFYVCRYYMDDGTIPTINEENILFKNNGDGTFTNVTIFAGVSDGLKPSFQPAFIDYDKDGWLDIYVINDRTDWGNALFKNNGDGTFTDVAPTNGSEVREQSPMSISVADINRDGHLDIFMSNTGTVQGPGMLLINNADGTFTDMADQYGFNTNEFPSSWGTVFVDLENDGNLEVYVNTVGITRDYLYKQLEGTFIDYPSAFIGPHEANSYAVAQGDIDNDGYADLMVQNSDGASSILWKNTGGSNSYIKITLKGTVSNRMALGSLINVYVGQQHYIKYSQCGENYLSQNSQHNIFGIGGNNLIDSVVIQYQSGIIERYINLDANQHYYFVEGETFIPPLLIAENTILCDGDSTIIDAGEFQSYTWNNGFQERYLTVTESGNYYVTVVNQLGIHLTSNTVSITVTSLPIISFNIENPECYNENNGSIQLEIEGDPVSFVIQWSNGAVGEFIENLNGGNYTYNYIDINGCTETGSAELVAPYEMVVFSDITNAIDSINGTVYLSINGGTPPYQIQLNGITVSDVITDISIGSYQLDIHDNNGCYINFAFEISNDSTTSLFDKNRMKGFSIYPNPLINSSILNLEIENGLQCERLSVIGIDGKKVYSKKSENKNSNHYLLDLSTVSSGMYFLEIDTQLERYFLKFIITQKEN